MNYVLIRSLPGQTSSGIYYRGKYARFTPFPLTQSPQLYGVGTATISTSSAAAICLHASHSLSLMHAD